MPPYSYVEQLGGLAALGGSAAGGFAIVKWFMEWIAGRLDKREARIDAGTDRLIKAMSEQVDKLTTRLETVEESLAECKRLHAKSEAEVLRLTALVEAHGEIRQQAARVVAADRLDQKAKGEG